MAAQLLHRSILRFFILAVLLWITASVLFQPNMVASWRRGFAPAVVLSAFAVQNVLAQTGTPTVSLITTTVEGKGITYSPQFTVPASAGQGATLLPNVDDPNAVDAQTVCPGYTASNVQRTAYGFNASLTLAGPAVSCPSICCYSLTDIRHSAMCTGQTFRI